MNKFAWSLATTAFGVVLGAGIAFAQANDPGVQKRMENQEQRIDQGVESGRLTPREAGRLEANQARIKQTEERMKADGQLTSAERARLHNKQDNASKRIYRQKHDRQQVHKK
jgi:hypothetical protein